MVRCNFLCVLCVVFLGFPIADFVYAETKDIENLGSMKYNLSACAVIRNESRYLKEWLEYHLLAGVDHFYLYNVESTDAYFSVLKPYIKSGIVTFIQWPNLGRFFENTPALSSLSTDLPIYENAAKYKAIHETKWLVFVDINEFLLSPHVDTLTEILEKYDDFPAVVLCSDYFDASVMYGLSERQLVIENTELTNEPFKPIEKKILKTIFKPNLTENFFWPPYAFEFKEKKSPVLLSKKELRINHYASRKVGVYTHASWKEKIRVDSRLLSEKEKTQLLDQYSIEDHELAISRFVPMVRQRLEMSSNRE